jgi:hypothetical protein
MVKNKEKFLIFFVFSLFFFFIFFQHYFVFFMHDDYGYASLSYGYIPHGVKPGCQYNFSHIIDFLKWQYNNWGGRIIFFFLEVIVLKFGIWPFRIIQSIVITLIFYLFYKIAIFSLEEEVPLKSRLYFAIILCSSYGFLPLAVLRESIYWATASFVYLWPLLFFFASIFFFLKYKNSEKVPWFWFSMISIFISSFSHEQTSITTLIFYSLLFFYEKFLKKHDAKVEALLLIAAFSGAILLFIAPGNIKRFIFHHPGNFSFLEGIENTIKGMFFAYFNRGTFLIYLFFSIVLLFLYFGKFFNNNIKIINKSDILEELILFQFLFPKNNKITTNDILRITVLFSLIYISLSVLYFIILFVLKVSIFSNLINFLIFVIFIGCILLLTFLSIKKLLIIFIASSIFLNQLFLFVMGGFPQRSALASLIMLLFLIAYIMLRIYNSERISFRKIFLVTFTALWITISFVNFSRIFYGYYRNSFVNTKNHQILKYASRRISYGRKVEKIYLIKLKDDLYAQALPYMDNYEYIESWIKFYYDISPKVQFLWLDYDENLLNQPPEIFVVK